MTDDEKEKLIRKYAAGDITWSALRTRGIDNFVDVLCELGRLGLRQPIAPMEGPNVGPQTGPRSFATGP